MIIMPYESNRPHDAGKIATNDKLLFGEHNRYAVFAIHTRGTAVEWCVTDALCTDPFTGEPEIIRQAATITDAIRNLA